MASPTKIVVIEDNPADVGLLRYGLDEQGEPYEIHVLTDGEQAIRFIEEHRLLPEPVPCAIVLDWHLPKHDGATVLKAIRREPVLQRVHVVALTTLSPREEAEMRNLGVRLFRAKPNRLDDWIELACDILEICREHDTAIA